MPNAAIPPQPALPDDAAMGEFATLVGLVARLRAPGGCPWNAEQTHQSLKRHLLEEAYEALEAIDGGDPPALAGELGDLLLQIALHTEIAAGNGHFRWDEVLRRLNEKLVRRHPHVFGGAVAASDAREVERNWERIKADERRISGRPAVPPSPVDGLPAALPALAYAQLMQERVARAAGFDWDDLGGVLDKVEEEIGEFRRAAHAQERQDELGDLLFALVNLCRWNGVHAEDALRQSSARFRRRYRTMTALAEQQGHDFAALPLPEKETLWQQAKRQQRAAAARPE